MTVAFNEERQLMTEFTDISYEVDNGLAWITINRPERYNAFRARTLDELIRAFKLAWGSSDVGVICLTGAGEKAFCTGGDQKQRAETGDYGPSETGLFEVDSLHRVIRDVPKPVIAAVNGFAIGGGHVLHVLCDLTIAADTAVFGQNGPRVGSFDAGFGTGYLARVVGEKRAREIWFLCRRYSAEQAADVGTGQQGGAGRSTSSPRFGRGQTKSCMLSPTALKILKQSFNTDTEQFASVGQMAYSSLKLFGDTPEAQEGVSRFQRQSVCPNLLPTEATEPDVSRDVQRRTARTGDGRAQRVAGARRHLAAQHVCRIVHGGSRFRAGHHGDGRRRPDPRRSAASR